MKKAIFVYNPLSGQRSVPGKLDYIIKRFMQEGVLLQPYRIYDGQQDILVKVLKENNYSYIVISGGDGTISSIVDVMLKNNINLPLGVIPSGTCNDFARSLGIPYDMKKCIDIILSGNCANIDVGLINEEKHFLNTCAGGAFVDVSYSTRSDLKRSLGPLAYYIKALGEVGNIKPIRFKIKTDTEIIEQDFLLFLILNGRHAAGFNNIIEKADISDGLMDIVLINNCLHIDMAALFFKVLRNDFLNDKNVMWLRTKTCTIEGDCNVALTIDGEEGGGLPISVKFLNKILKVFVK
jgi:diacylglycerol kinase (ATP)